MGECLCGKKFKTYNGLRSHSYICQLTNSKTTEQNISEIPSQGEIWKMVSKLIRDNEKMKKEIQQLRSSVLYQQRKIPVMQLLKDKCRPKQTYESWIKNGINLDNNVLNLVFDDGQIRGAIAALENSIERLDERDMFIRAFNHKRDIVYIYKKSGWVIMSTQDLEQIWKLLVAKLIKKFNIWEKEPHIIKMMKTYDGQGIWLKNFEKTIGQRVNPITAINKIKHGLYNYLKCDPIKFVNF